MSTETLGFFDYSTPPKDQEPRGTLNIPDVLDYQGNPRRQRPGSVTVEQEGPEGLQEEAIALIKGDFAHLVDLLWDSHEDILIRLATDSLREALDETAGDRPEITYPQTPYRSIDMRVVKLIRNRTNQIMLESSCGFSFPMRVIPPERLWGICAPDKNGRMTLTDTGQAILKILHDFPTLSVWQIAGGASESCGTKPWSKRRPRQPVEAFKAGSINTARVEGDQEQIQPADVDLLLVYSSTPHFREYRATNDEALTSDFLRTIARSINGIPRYKTPNLATGVKASSRRPGFQRVKLTARGFEHWEQETDTVTRFPRFHMADLFFPGKGGIYGPKNRLIPFLMTKRRSDIPILLIPYERDNRLLFWGLAVDFFGGFADKTRSGQRIKPVRLQDRELWLAHYPFPQYVFPEDDPAESIFNLGHMLRTLPWNDEIPIILSPQDPVPSEEELADDKIFLSRSSQRYLQDVVQQMALTARDNPEKFGSVAQRKEIAASLLTDDVVRALKGDPLMATFWLLKRGETFLHYDIRDWILGWGIFSKDGLFPKMGEFLEEEINIRLGNRVTTIKRGDLLLDVMSRLPQGGTREVDRDGWQVFLDFLFASCGNNRLRVAEFLTPVIDPRSPKGFLKSVLVKMDERFTAEFESSGQKEFILEILRESEVPLNIEQLATESGIPQDVIFEILDEELSEGQVLFIGGPVSLERRDGSLLRCLPTIYWTDLSSPRNREMYDAWESDPRFFHPLDRVIHALEEKPFLTVEQIATETGMETKDVRKTLADLNALGSLTWKNCRNQRYYRFIRRAEDDDL